jgi:hypothetical protein
LSEYLKNEDEYIFSKNDYTVLENTNIEDFKKIMNTVIPDVVDLSIKNIFLDDKVFTTPFDKQGVYDQTSNIGECKFPFFEKNRKKFVYQCIPRTGGVMCPTRLDYQRKPDKWGYCPEKILETKKELNFIDINTEGDGKDYHEGSCKFPYMNKEKIKDNEPKSDGENMYKLKYDCITENKDNKDEEFKWCPLKPNYPISKIIKRSKKNGKNGNNAQHQYDKYDDIDKTDDGNLLRAADKFENVQLNKWYNGKLSITGISSKKYLKGYCQPPPVKTKKLPIVDKGEDTLPEITLDNYIPNNCNTNFTPSKGGYKREQLFKFGKNYLKIPYSQMMKSDDVILPKEELCKIINNKYREIKTQGQDITDEDRKLAYSKGGKNIDNCEDGESKGGYTLNELKELAINYYGITETQAKDMKKQELCGHIKKVLKQLVNEEVVDDKTLKDKEHYKYGTVSSDEDKLSMIYPHDINLCKETPNRGGIGSKEIKKIANENFGINIEHKHKDDICDEIEKKMKENQKIVKKDIKPRETRLSASKIKKLRYSFNELFENPEKAEVIVSDAVLEDEDEDEIEEVNLDAIIKSDKESKLSSKHKSNSRISTSDNEA